jgi:crotonobetainyl-CoA:carnitine CoA-transferase CaiB-like acyl-CoA transferase
MPIPITPPLGHTPSKLRQSTPIGVSFSETLMARQILDGIRVLELGQLIAGPFAAKTLADFGAHVVKVEPPGQGDPLRKWRMLHEDTSVWWEAQSRNKQSIAIDLRQPEGQALVRKLASEADVLIENFRPGTMEKWGLGWDVLHADNPKLIMVRVSGYGQSGPKRDEPGFAAVAEAMSGLRYLTGEPGRPPVRAGCRWATRSPACMARLACCWRCTNAMRAVAKARSSTWRCTSRCSI